MVECIKFNPELRYTQEELSAALPYLPEEPSAIHKIDSAPREYGVQNGCKYIVTSYFSEIATETLEDKLVKLESDRVMEAVNPHETVSESSII